MNYASSILGLLPGGRRAPGIGQLTTKIEAYLPPDQVERVREAFEYAETAHKGQKRKSGEAFITHPIAVADILADLHLDGATIAAAILHDVVEDTPSSMAEVEQKFGKEVAEIVDGVTKLDQVQFKSRKEAQAESFRKMILAMVRDIRVIMVKLADRTHNMRTLASMPPEKRRAVARETLDIYGPIANRLGIHSIKLELEELGFRTLYPQRYRIIERELKRARGNQREFLPKIVKAVRKSLADSGVNGNVEAREKHLYSVYVKMRRKHLSLSQVVDMFGIRIVVGSVDECYRTLGLVHGLYRPMPGRFKDYIAIPRVNGYQSLHTSLFGPNGTPIEVQIRTEDMHRPGGVRHRRALAVQVRREGRRVAAGACARMAAERHGPARGLGRGTRRERQGRPVPRQGLRVHARRATSCACRAVRAAWTSPTRCTPASASAASPPRSTGGWCRCAPCCETARPWRSSRPRARSRTPPGRVSSCRRRRAPRSASTSRT